MTIDGGVTWRRITLPASHGLGAVEFVDPMRGWTVSAGPLTTPLTGGTSDVYQAVVGRTSDGGATWDATTLGGNYRGTLPVLSMRNADSGFLLMSGQRHGDGQSALLQTSDKGRSWTNLGTSSWLGPSIHFLDDQRGVASGSSGDVPPDPNQIRWTVDGGRHWRPSIIDAPTALEGESAALVGDPQVTASALIVPVAYEHGDQTSMIWYLSADNGMTFRSLGRLDVAGSQVVSVAILDATTWLAAESRGSIDRTMDAGKSWTTQAGPFGAQVVELIAAPPREVWALTQGPAGGSLFTSADGGVTWQAATLP